MPIEFFARLPLHSEALAREIPHHLERRVSVLETVRERLDIYPDLAPPPALLEKGRSFAREYAPT
jgi:hypothetical protein